MISPEITNLALPQKRNGNSTDNKHDKGRENMKQKKKKKSVHEMWNIQKST